MRDFDDITLVYQHTRVSLDAGIAQLVERNLAKVEVASSSLVSRSKFSEKGKPPGFPFSLPGSFCSKPRKII